MAVIGEEESLGVFFILILLFCPYGAVFMTGLRYPRRCHWAGMMDALSGRLRGNGWLKIKIAIFLWHLFIDILHFGSFQSAFDGTKGSTYTEKRVT